MIPRVSNLSSDLCETDFQSPLGVALLDTGLFETVRQMMTFSCQSRGSMQPQFRLLAAAGAALRLIAVQQCSPSVTGRAGLEDAWIEAMAGLS